LTNKIKSSPWILSHDRQAGPHKKIRRNRKSVQPIHMHIELEIRLINHLVMETLSNRNLAEEYILLCYALNRKMEHTMR
jgi:hypothetical protein